MLSIADAPLVGEAPDGAPRPAEDKSHKPKGHRRIPAAKERSFRYVMAAVPEGSQRARRGTNWLEQAREDVEIVLMRSDAQRNVRAVCAALMASLHAKTMTVSPGWDWLMEATRLSESTVKRTIRLLRRRGLLGLVAGGRLAEHGTAGQTANDRAVYVLCIRTENMPVDITGRPTPGGERSTPRARERLSEPRADGAAAPLDHWAAEAYGLVPARPVEARRQPAWPGNKPVQGRTRRERHEVGLAAARTVQARSFALQRTSAAWVLWACKRFFDAGWTAGDVLHALDNHPKDRRIPHDGADGVKYPAKWLAARLGEWVEDGRPVKSRSQQAIAAQEQAAAERLASQQRRAAFRARAEAPVEDRPGARLGDARGAAIALAVLHGRMTPDEARAAIAAVTSRNNPSKP